MTTETPTDLRSPVEKLADEVEAALAAGNLPGAYELANKAISRGHRHPLFFTVRAQKMEQGGHVEFALNDYERAAELAPEDAALLDAFSRGAFKIGAHARAIALLDKALAASPGNSRLLYRRGLAHAHSDNFQAAQRDYEATLAVDPQSVDAMASLALILARRGETDRARSLAAKVLEAMPGHVTAQLALAQADLADGRYADAAQRLTEGLNSNLLPLESHPAAYAMLGDALDAEKRYPEAFAAYQQENDALIRMHASALSGSPGGEAMRHLNGYFENERAERWRAPDDGGRVEGEIAGHVFLLGFMRSGTTLLEQVLAGSPQIAVLEEKALLAPASERYMTSVPGLETLARLDGKDLARQRQLYWRAVRDAVPETAGRIILDKQPLNTTKLPLIAKLFPNARILFALRDPRDVVLSCFRRNLKVTASQFDFLSLDTCARFYAGVMRFGEISRGLLSLNLLEHRYEAMVEDFEGRIRAVCEFVGVEWSDDMRRFSERDHVAQLLSPSAAQIRRPLYAEGAGHWRNYAEQLAPVQPVLAPWVKKFGYPEG